MKISLHTGRNGSASHNDRTAPVKTNIKEKESNNICWVCSDKYGKSFAEIERNYYIEKYTPAVERTNETYIKTRQLKRCKTVDDLLKNQKTKPDESIMQIGKMEDKLSGTVTKEHIAECLESFFKKFFKQYGSNIHILDCALHCDEIGGYHAHLRVVYDYIDTDGILKVGMDKGLKNLGFEPPEPDKPIDRHNNRKQSFTREMRELWQNVVKSKGFELQDNECFDGIHLTALEYKKKRLAEEVKELEKRKNNIEKSIKYISKYEYAKFLTPIAKNQGSTAFIERQQ